MRLIDRSDIELWARKIDSKTYLPILVSRLVKATTHLNTFCEFPSGSAANIGGWDGIVICRQDSRYAPKGTSLWEFGTEASVNKKAREDYKKRTDDPLGYDPSQSTFIFLTPRMWADKDKFRNEKLAEGIWKDIKVFDSRNLEEWLDDAAAVSRWFAAYAGRVPSDGVITTEVFWKEWAFGPKITLPPSLVTIGREHEVQELLNFLNSETDIKAVRASSKDEAVAFIVAAAMQFEQADRERFFAKTLIVEQKDSFRAVNTNLHKLNLIAKFDEYKISYSGVVDGHHVLLPLGADDPYSNDVIILSELPRELMIDELIKMGITEDQARNLCRESARNLTVMKRLMKFPGSRVAWIESGSIEELFPALLIGRWNEANTGDIEILEGLYGHPYAIYQDVLSKWRDLPESPIIQIAHTWRLTSPLDAWANLAGQIRPSDFEKLKNAVFQALSEEEPEADENTPEFNFGFRPPKKYSRWAREGLLQSLILIGLYGQGLKLATSLDAQLWVDQIIEELLHEATGAQWNSLDHEMPLIAEASPSVFLEKTNQSLISNEKEIMAMFNAKPGLFMDNPNHTGLLWALESLAWMPEYFLDSVVVLARLDKEKPVVKMVNKPINSLREIFKSWYPQTLASFQERMQALETILEISFDTGWTLLLSMLPSGHEVGHPTHSLRWRMFGKSKQLEYNWEEQVLTYSSVVELIIKYFNGAEKDLANLVDRSDKLSTSDRRKLLDFIASKAGNIQSEENLIWKELGKTLSQHRSHPTAEWALPEENLVEYEKLYELFTPKDQLAKYLWLFDEHWPQFPEGEDWDSSDDYQAKGNRLQERRVAALTAILDAYGSEKIKEIAQIVKEPHILGQTLAVLENFTFTENDLTFFLNNGEGPLSVLQAYFGTIANRSSGEWSLLTIKQLRESGLNNEDLVKILVVLDQNPEIWLYLENQKALASQYWAIVRPFFYRLTVEDKATGLRYLIEHRRLMSAIDESANYIKELPTALIAEMLTKAATEEAVDANMSPRYQIGRLFEELYKRDDITKDDLIRLEWLYIEVLDRYSRAKPTLLEKELLNNAELFIELIKWVYVPNTPEKKEKESKELSPEQLTSRATRAYRLLREISQVPGMNDDKTLDVEFLKAWVDKVRELAKDADRAEVTDSQLGQILAQYPEDGKSNWPPEPIAKLIESINTKSIKSGFSSATFNKRGSSSRGAFAGGDIERGHAKYFERLASNYKIKYPNVATILLNLAKGYRVDAKRMDDQAERDKLDY